MMKRIYEVAGIKISVNTPFDYEETPRYKKFLSMNNDKAPDINFEFLKVEEDLNFNTKPVYSDVFLDVYIENNKTYRVHRFGSKKTQYACMTEKNKDSYICYAYPGKQKYLRNNNDIFKTLSIEKVLNKFGALILHSSYINWEGEAILFTAPSGTGKTTQANLWKEYENVQIINGDRTILRKINGKWMACGLPYAGSSEYYEKDILPIKAIVILEKANCNKLSILSDREIFTNILRECTINYWDREFVENSTKYIIDLIENIPVYKLSCKPDKDAVNLLKYKLLKGRD